MRKVIYDDKCKGWRKETYLEAIGAFMERDVSDGLYILTFVIIFGVTFILMIW